MGQRPISLLEPMAMEKPMVEPIASYYRLFMGASPRRFNCREDKVESWLVKKKAFDVIEFVEQLKIRYGTYMLIEDIETWWHMQFVVRYDDMHPD